MKKNIIILIMATTGLFSCRQGSKSTSDTVNKETLNSTENVQRQKPLTNHNEKYIDTKYEYTDSTGRSLIIQNSFPKSGIHYTDPTGKG
jgi:protein involved in sex pheromone biosynthesis